MLIDFSVGNYRSIKELQTFSALATKIKELPENVFNIDSKINILKSALILGANASGKTNFIRALFAFMEFIDGSSNYKAGEKIPMYDPFRLDIEYLHKPTVFEIEFIPDNKIRYNYCVHFNSKEIVKESLVYYPNNQKKNLFNREINKPIKFSDSLKGPKASIEQQLLPNTLFLSKAANSNIDQLKKIYIYFREKINISLGGSRGDLETSQYIMKDDYYQNKVNQFMKFADTGIESVGIRKKELDDNFVIKGIQAFPDDGQNAMKDDISIVPYTVHTQKSYNSNDKEIEFLLSEESDGTIKLFGLAGKIIRVLKYGGVLVIDELNNGLHPVISEHIVKLFNNSRTNPNNSQLIITSHDTSLLNNKLFRRDQIWFTVKHKSNATEIYPLSEFDYKEVRANIPFDKWYITGKFGAIPVINEFNPD